QIGLTYDDRDFLGITTIGSTDKSKRQRHFVRKQKKRLAKERKRRERGAKTQAKTQEKQSPGGTQKKSRAKWVRRRKSGTCETVETERSPADSYNGGAEVVSQTSALLTTALPDGRAPSASVVLKQELPSVVLLPRKSIMPLSNAGHQSHRQEQPT